MVLKVSRLSAVQSRTDNLKLAGVMKQGKEEAKGSCGYEVSTRLNV
jgi:hypothetical protein